MKCPRCESTSCRKNGRRSGKQNYLCKNCGRQFFDPSASQTRESAENYPNNGYAQTSVAEVTQLPLVKQLPEETKTVQQPDSVFVTAAELISMLSESWLESSAFNQIVQKMQEVAELSAQSGSGISILLLDAENIKLDINTEAFLATICKYNLQAKIAFANWRNPTMGKQDIELYERGYQLIHVPGGKDSADGKMIALGSSILGMYPRVKEVFVCSCDQILTHLCNQLQNQGLTVYWVRRQVQSLKVENRNTGEVNYYSIAMQTSIPSFDGLVQKIEALIKAEKKSIDERLINLALVANLFQERTNLTLNPNYLDKSRELTPEKNDIPPSTEQQDKSLQTVTESNQVEVNASAATLLTSPLNSITSKEELETIIIEIIQAFQVNYPQTELSVSKLGAELRTASGQTPNSIVKKLKLSSSFTKFLHSCPTFKLKKTDKEYVVALDLDASPP